jgi:molybdopterin-guanine dinucleotide biosynthesis protein A
MLDALLLENAQIAIPRTETGLQPVFALMRREVLPNLATHLANGQYRMQDWCRGLSLCVVDFPDNRAFANINTRDELSALTRPA